MRIAADMEDHTQKHPVTPGEVLPARELLGDLLLKLNKPGEALEAYVANLKKHPNRFNSLYGAGLAVERSNDAEKAKLWYLQLTTIAYTTNSNRPELEKARLFLKNNTIN